MEASLERRRKKVRAWLQDVFGDEDVPEYEINENTVDYLYQLSQESCQRDRLLQLVTKDFHQKANEYKAEAQRLSGVLQRVELSTSSLSQQGSSSLTALSRLAMLLDVRDTSNTWFLLAMQELDAEIETVEKEVELETKKLNKLTSNYHNMLHQCSSLERVLDTAKQKSIEDEELDSKKEEKVTLFLKKVKQYNKEVAKLKAHLSQTKVEEPLFHENLVKKSEALKDVQAQLEPLKEKLESYSLLPPDLDQAKLKLAEYKLALEKLDTQLTECIGNTII